MEDILYNAMNWPEIEAIVYSEHDIPHNILGVHKRENGYLIQCFFSKAISVKVKLSDHLIYEMEKVDEEGFYAILLSRKTKPKYTYLVTYDNGAEVEVIDSYNFKPVITAKDLELFSQGIHYTIYEKLGAHKMTHEGVEGVYFAVWAPTAIRVSVVGDFNVWDGRRHPMRRLGDSGVHELFIPGLDYGEIYKYEIKVKGGLPVLKSDPYGFYSELRPATASVVCDIDSFNWKDQKWVTKRKKTDTTMEPMLVYEVHLGSWKKPSEENGSFYNYRDIAPMLADYVKEMGYTHVELLPIMEHPYDGSWGYQVTGYYAATSRHGKPQDLMYFIDYMHNQGIGVILDWVPAHFPKDAHGLATFDGTCLYEHLDPRKGEHPHWGTLIFNYGRPQVSNFLIANALFWIEKYHADGIRMDAVASMLYLDYGKNDGEWVANKFGGNQNLEAMEFLKHLNSINKRRKTGAVVMAEESTAWPNVTKKVEEDGLGFDYKWNMGWMNDFLDYMRTDPLFRKGKHGELTFSLHYAYSEKFILVLSHDEVVHQKGSMINKMPGEYPEKLANLRLTYGFMLAHPGKKLLFMGQDFAQIAEWNEDKSLEWDLLKIDSHKQMQTYVKAINQLYKKYPLFYSNDYDYQAFEWISNQDADHSVIAFLRKDKKNEKEFLFVFNFTPVHYLKFRVGAPFAGRYKEVFNSNAVVYGGTGEKNKAAKTAKKVKHDGKDYAIDIVLPPLSMVVFDCMKIDVKKESKTSANAKKKVKMLKRN